MIGNFPVVLNFNRIFSNSTGSFVTNFRFSPMIGRKDFKSELANPSHSA